MSMSAQSPRLQFIIELPNSPKTKVKGMILVRGPCDETQPLTFRLMKQFNVFSRCVQVTGPACGCIFRMLMLCTHVSLLWVVRAGKSRMGKLVHWVKRTSFEKIRRLPEILEQKRHHEVLLTKKKLHDLSRYPSPYCVPIFSRPLPS